MVLTAQRPSAPYSRINPVLDTLHRLRERGLPEPLNSEKLKTMGIAEGLAYQAIQAFRFLGIIDEDGNHTDAMERLRAALSDEDAKNALADIVRKAYKPIFDLVDPAKDESVRVENAFRQYNPEGQRPRMVYLFLALCREAGIIADDSAKPRSPVRSVNGAKRKAQRQPERSQPEPQPPVQAISPSRPEILDGAYRELPVMSRTYNVIAGLVDQLPKDGKWTKERRDRWVRAMEATVDLLVEVAPDSPVES